MRKAIDLYPRLPLVDHPLGEFDSGPHLYTIKGVPVPSVTQILNEEGFVDFSEVPRHLLMAAQDRGTRVHRAIHYYLENDLEMESVWPEDRGYVASAVAYLNQAKRRVLLNLEGRPIGVEFRFWDLKYLFGGGVDFLGWDDDGYLGIDDFKTGHPDDVAAPLQTAAYEHGVRQALLAQLPLKHPIRQKPIRRRAVKLYKDGRVGRVAPYDDPRDWSQFLNALSCTHYRRNGCKHDTPASRELRRLQHGYV